MTIKPAAQIIDNLPAGELERLGMTDRLIRHARSTGRFAAAWYLGISQACVAAGVECPLGAFNFKEVDDAGNQATSPPSIDENPHDPASSDDA